MVKLSILSPDSQEQHGTRSKKSVARLEATKKRIHALRKTERYNLGNRSTLVKKTETTQVDQRDENPDRSSYPLIDRVPTAMGYHSDGSEDEWLEEKSRCSRYTISGDQMSDKEDEEEDRDKVVADDEPEDSRDRYSLKATNKKKKKTMAQPVTISRLWSESTDSDAPPAQWNQATEQIQVAYVDGGEISCAEEKGGDPIYDVPQKNKTRDLSVNKTNPKKKKAPNEVTSTRSPGSPTHDSDTSTLTDPLENMLHFAGTNKVVKEIEEKLRLLKKVAKSERVLAKKNKKEAVKTAKKSLFSAVKAKKSATLDSKKETADSKKATTKQADELKKGPADVRKPKAEQFPLQSTPSDMEITQIIPLSTKSAASKVRPKELRKKAPIPVIEKPTAAKSVKVIEQKRKETRAGMPVTSQTSTQSLCQRDTETCKTRNDKDLIEMTRSMSIVEPGKSITSKANIRRPFPKFLSRATSGDETSTVGTGTVPTVESIGKSVKAAASAEQEMRDMYTKSLLTEDSDTDPKKSEGADPTASSKSMSKRVNSFQDSSVKKKERGDDSILEGGTHDIRKSRLNGCIPPSWNFGLRSRSSDAASVQKSSKSFWNKRSDRTGSVQRKGKRTTKPDKVTVQQSTSNQDMKMKGVMELDEYSGATRESNNESDLARCLRFYSCSTAANQLDSAIQVMACSDMTDVCKSTREPTTDRMVGFPSSPIQTVEVVLDESRTTVLDPTQLIELGSNKNTSGYVESTDCLEEVPPLPLSRVPSVVVNVSDMNLHLDGDSENETRSHVSSLKVDRRQRSDISITSIILPNPTSNTSDKGEQEAFAEEEELQLQDYINEINKKKGIRRFLGRFGKAFR